MMKQPTPVTPAMHQTALAHPCLFAFETIHPRFCQVVDGWSIIVTVAAGHE